ncbi:MAG: sortase [Clostridia bacterium]|nr:sortase [Clostridia bacterium]
MKKGKVVILTVLVCILIGALVYLMNDSLNFGVSNEIDCIAVVNQVANNEIIRPQKVKTTDVSSLPSKMGNYEVVGQLVIDKIGVKRNILAICDDPALDLSIAKLYGPEVNEPGNFCVCGHRETMFKTLDTLKKGDTLYMINKKTKTKVNYEVYKVYECSPYDLSCLEQNEDGKREVTIITCTPSGAKRVVCKARAT